MKLEKTVDMMLSEDYVERFKAEFHQLVNRKNKLQKTVRAYAKDELDFEPKCSLDLLIWQLKTMQEYEYILKRRAEIEGIELTKTTSPKLSDLGYYQMV